MPLFLVRHAQAGSRNDFVGDDTLRPLTGRGRHQAADIAGLIKEMAGPMDLTIRTSPYRRCIETIAPLAAATGSPMIVDDVLAEGPTENARQQVRLVAASMANRAEVWCSHGDIIPAVIEMLSVQDGLDLGPNPRVQKASIWVLTTNDEGRFLDATYIGPTC